MQSHVNKSCDAKFKNEVLLKCYEALAAIGFTRYRKESVDWPIDKNFNCWVGLNTGLFDDHILINPFIGVHAVELMKLYTALEGRKYNRSVATYGVHMGVLTPKERVFEFTRETNIEEESQRLAQLYLDVGLPYAKSLASYDALLPLLQDRVEVLGGYPERISSCLYLMGRKEEAKKFTTDFLLKQPNYFEGFSIPFLEKLNSETA